MIKIKNLYPGSWGSNCYLAYEGSHGVVIDPSANADRILSEAKTNGVTLEGILLTHGHFDHIVSVDTLRERIDVPVWIHEGDQDFLEDSQKNAFSSFFGMERHYKAPDNILSDGDVLTLGETKITVIHTPGHTGGSVCFLCDGVLFTGDTLFASGYGRYDLYGGDGEALRTSLLRLDTLQRDLRICPGHGEDALLGDALDRILR